MNKTIKFLTTLLLLAVSVGAWAEQLEFDFEDETAHRNSGNNSYSSTPNTYTENGVNISLTYADAVTSGSPLVGNANVMGRIAKNTTNSPVVLIGPINNYGNKITTIYYTIKGVSAMKIVAEYSTDNSTWNTLQTISSMPTTKTIKTISNLNITAETVYLRFTVSVTTSTTSSRDFQLDDVILNYEPTGSSDLTASDLALTNASVALNFDLYNNSSDQTISYTTSSTGAVTVSGGDGYVTTSVDAINKTITVTPTAVTPIVQTITVSQAADETYAAGSVTFTVSVTNSDPNVSGTQNNPYTVAQARAAIDAGTGKTGVYATGIVSAIPTAYSTQYSNITFNFVDEEGDTEFLQAYRCVGDKAANVQVGDIVVVSGDLTKYGSTYEFGSGCQLVSLTHPSIPVITTADVTLEYNATYGEIEYSITNPTENENLSATTDANWINNISVTANKVTFSTTVNEGEEDRTATFKLSYEGAADKDVTVTQKHYVPDYATLPFEFNGGHSVIANTAGLTQEGLGSDYSSAPLLKFDDTGDYVILKINERPGTLTFDIKNNSFSGGTFTVQTSEDGEVYADLKVYTEITGTQNETFNNLGENVRYIKWIYTNKVSGNVGLGNIQLAQYVEPSPVITVTPSVVSVEAAENEGTMAITYDNIVIGGEGDFAIEYYDDAECNEAIDSPNWIVVSVAKQDGNYVVNYSIAANEGDARTAYMKVYALDDDANVVYSELITITQAAYEAPATEDNYQLFTGSIVEGDYLIVYDGYAMNTTVTSDRLQYDVVEPTENVITTNNSNIVWHIAPSGDYWTIYNAAANAYAASTGAKSKAQMLADGTDDKALWTVSGTETYEFVNKKNAASNVNANLRNNGTYGFACYATGTGGALSLYKKVEATPEYVPVSISAAGMATFCSDKALDFTAVDAIHAYYVNVDNSGNLTFTRIRKIPANTGVLLRNAQGEDQGAVAAINVPVLSGEAEPVDNNAFVAVFEEIAQLASTAGGFNNYILNKKNGRLGFYHANDQKVGAGKAYLRIAESIPARDFFGFNEGEATGIENVNHETTTNGRCYNLNGQQVSANYKGIVIVNGKKTIVK